MITVVSKKQLVQHDLTISYIGNIINIMRDWTVQELATLAQVSGRYIRIEIERGHLAARKRGGVWLIDDEDAQAWRQAREERIKKGVRRKYKKRKQ